MWEAAGAGQRVADQGTVILDESGGGVRIGKESFVFLQVVDFGEEGVEVGGVVEVTEGLRERGDGQFDEGFGVGGRGAADLRHEDRIRDQRGLLGKIWASSAESGSWEQNCGGQRRRR